MRTSTLVAVVVAALPVLAFTQSAIAKSATAYNPPEKTVAEILEAKIRQSWSDYQRKDAKAYGDLLGEGFTAVEPDGQGPRDKEAALANMNTTNLTNYSVSDFKITPLGATAQLARYSATVDIAMSTGNLHAGLAVVEVWKKQGDDWKLVHFQETEVK